MKFILLLNFLSLILFYPILIFASAKNISIECSAGIASLNGASSRLNGGTTTQLTPKPSGLSPATTAEEMNLETSGMFEQVRSDATLEILYKLNISQLWPKFLDDGTWITSNISIQLELEMLAREIQKDGTIKILGGSEGNRIIRFDKNGDADNLNNRISIALLSPKIYQMAVSHPNNPPYDNNFPHSYLDIQQNNYIKEQIRNGVLQESDFVSATVTCKLN
ncbi:MAG: hypothetical protein JNL11_02285 [Bdellovibrionaceae bacterium]|nr:hypothetical protein [Pseudobdellovibrionaceae bacterium]